MAVELIKEEVECPKELNDVRKAVVAVVEDVKAGKDVGEIATGNLQLLADAISGLDKIPDEISEDLSNSVKCLGLLGGDLAGILLGS